MVRGVSKRVIVVKSPDLTLFEEAIFLIRDEEYTKGKDNILHEACKIAESYVKNKPRIYRPIINLTSRTQLFLTAALSFTFGAMLTYIILPLI